MQPRRPICHSRTIAAQSRRPISLFNNRTTIKPTHFSTALVQEEKKLTHLEGLLKMAHDDAAQRGARDTQIEKILDINQDRTHTNVLPPPLVEIIKEFDRDEAERIKILNEQKAAISNQINELKRRIDPDERIPQFIIRR